VTTHRESLRWHHLAWVALTLALPGCARTVVHIDEDLLIPVQSLNEDRDYTLGIQFETWDDPADPFAATSVFGRAHAGLDSALGLHDDPDQRGPAAWTLGSVVYTPEDIGASAPVLSDRPYASLIYYADKQVSVREGESAVGTELRFGVLGLKVADAFQGSLHQYWRSGFNSEEPEDPKGWSNQISHGGEPTLLYRVSTDRVLSQDGRTSDLSLSTDVNLGYQVNAATGLLWRVGKLDSGPWTTPFDPIGRASWQPASTVGERYLWFGGRVRVVGYDVLLQGQFRDSDYEVSSGDVERVVGHGAAGFTVSTARGGRFTYSLNVRTKELESPGRSHVWGSMTFSQRF
jgi:hypothetical protein